LSPKISQGTIGAVIRGALLLGAVFFSVKKPALVEQFDLIAVFLIESPFHLVLQPSWHHVKPPEKYIIH